MSRFLFRINHKGQNTQYRGETTYLYVVTKNNYSVFKFALISTIMDLSFHYF